VELVEEREGKDGSNAWDGLEKVESRGVFDLGLLEKGALEGADEPIVVAGQSEIGLDAGAYDGVKEGVGDLGSVALIWANSSPRLRTKKRRRRSRSRVARMPGG
jgi:hypothetical protein